MRYVLIIALPLCPGGHMHVPQNAGRHFFGVEFPDGQLAPASPMRAIVPGARIKLSMAPARASGSRTGVMRPLTPSRTTSRQPGTSVTTAARPMLMPSMMDVGVPSRQEGSTSTWAAAR